MSIAKHEDKTQNVPYSFNIWDHTESELSLETKMQRSIFA